jgi:hypothetical protein
MNNQLKSDFLNYLTDVVNDFEYGDIDGFIEDYELSEEDIDECFKLVRNVNVVEKPNKE